MKKPVRYPMLKQFCVSAEQEATMRELADRTHVPQAVLYRQAVDDFIVKARERGHLAAAEAAAAEEQTNASAELAETNQGDKWTS